VQLVADAVATTGMTDEQAEARRKVEAAVKACVKQFDEDQKFDKPLREQIKKDRNYASGEAQANWAVSTNMIGSAIDVLVATLYARDPDVSVTPAAQVDAPPDPITGISPPQPQRRQNEDFAKSLQIVLSALWKTKKAQLKPRMRRVIRSILSASHGWLKVLPATEMAPDPLAQSEFNTLQANVAKIASQITSLNAGQTIDGLTATAEELETQKGELDISLAALGKRLEVESCYGFTFDVVKPENMQVGTDVELLEEYLDADSNTEIMYFRHDQLREKFPTLTDKDLQEAEKYYRKAPKNANKGEVTNQSTEGSLISRMYPNSVTSEETYTSTDPQDGARPFARVMEKWDKTNNSIYTWISGVKVWAREPYQPSWKSSRFYPYFYFSINEVDGERCPQSLSSRGAKLQDEYASVRSNLRITRRRSIPNTMFDATGLSDEEAQKVSDSVIAELVPMRTTKPGTKLSDLFTPKPVPNIDIRLYDTTPIVMDFERTFGVQEAQQQVQTVEKTATQVDTEQTSFNGRTGTWRDTIETTLSEMAQFCAEVALQKIKPEVAQKIAGPAVFWPYGMALEDIVSLADVSIAAGTTGKPKNAGDREAWGVIYGQIKESIAEIAALEMQGQFGLANALKELVRETMRRFGDEGDLSRFFPPPPVLPAAAGAGAPGEPPPGSEPGEPPAGEMPLEGGEALPPAADGRSPAQNGMASNGFFGSA